MKVLDLFAGLGGWSTFAKDEGHEVCTVDLEPSFHTTICADILTLRPDDLPWRPDLILASPPCEKFSVLRIGRNWTPEGSPKNDAAALAVELVGATLRLIADLEPVAWVMENPRAKLRVLPVMDGIERRTVTYCQYGHKTQKPTDLWGGFPSELTLRPVCAPRADCHLHSPRGTQTGLQGGTAGFLKGFWSDHPFTRYGNQEVAWRELDAGRKLSQKELAALRALVPAQLGEEVTRAALIDVEAGRRAPKLVPSRTLYQIAAFPDLTNAVPAGWKRGAA